MKTDYEEMLKRARSQLPSGSLKHKRFEIPRPRCHVVGMRTVFRNYKETCDVLNRDAHHLLKFLSREMATAGTTDKSRVVFQGKFSYDTFERLLKRYVDEFVTCPVCKSPDTKIVREKRLCFLICEACGARSSARSV
ncbi:MAG: translation initiation factor IF-2 subunit beta [Candidatus Bathyarchaeota archaeon]|nr:MAG: translation initiation factor IF-2 subunit beta [Candidatus Bathyarchaeota archaeon]